MRLSEYELDITKELISIALANAADAFSKMAGEKVLVHQFDLTIGAPDAKAVLPEGFEASLHVLTTEVKGNLEGKSYLVFNQSDTKRICKVFAPGQPVYAGEGLGELEEALLLELDNILSAAVITQLSNFLDTFIYGGVPGLRTLTPGEALNRFGAETQHFDVVFHIHARFKSYRTNLQPSFIWYFKSEFLEAIRSLVQNKKQMSLLKSSSVKIG
jgi:chemotaxis protein CheY-P-specific phosphatase CheC